MVQDSGFRVQDPESRVQGSGFRVQGSWFGVDHRSLKSLKGPAKNGKEDSSLFEHLGVRVGIESLGFGVWCLGLGVRCLRFRDRIAGLKIQGSGDAAI